MRRGATRRFVASALTSWCAIAPAAHRAEAADPPREAAIALDDPKAEPKGWSFVGGQEFPGAKGEVATEPAAGGGDRPATRLSADFRGGGVYVGCWRDFESTRLPEVEAFSMRVRARNISKVGVRIVDETGQCHQSAVDLPAGASKGGEVLTLRVRDLVGGEHWGGANDGRWHGSPRGLGLNLGRDRVGRDPADRATLWIEGLTAQPTATGVPTLASASLAPARFRPGFGTMLKMAWDAEPLGADCGVFVHVVEPSGRIAFQADHAPPVPTSGWSGRVAYEAAIVAPTDLAPGRYDVVIGLWDGRPAVVGGGRNRPFRVDPRSGLSASPHNACRVGSVEVSADAPLPTLPAPTLDLSKYRLTFDEGFDGPLDVSAWGPGTRWIAHTPSATDFGDAGFGDPGPDSPFSTKDGILTIEARKAGDRWRSGLLSSVDPKGAGFSQKFGYFEMRAKLPKGLGTWPAFWLLGVPQLVERGEKTITQIEIDVVEQYGVGPNALHTTLHLWGPGKSHRGVGAASIVAGMTDDFHTYGVSVEEDETIFYFDGSEIRREPTWAEAKVPLYLLVDLALGGGWPIDATPNPSRMLVDHVRAYRRR